jgi:hypothetical protein
VAQGGAAAMAKKKMNATVLGNLLSLARSPIITVV